jgi:hypothetical protein
MRLVEMLELADYYELLALHRVLMEVKFSVDVQDRALLFSPLVATLSNKVVEEIIQLQEKVGEQQKAEEWRKWRVLDGSRREWNIIIHRLKSSKKWTELSVDEKSSYIKMLASPLEVDAKTMLALIEIGDKRFFAP